MDIKQIKQHFQKVDPIIYKVIKSMDLKILKPSENHEGYFRKLCREIISQQLAGWCSKSN